MAYVVNAETGALWFYANYPFNAFCEFNGMYLATSDAGLVQVDTGDLDDTLPIDASFSFGKLALAGNAPLGRIENLYVSALMTKPMKLTLAIDREKSYDYRVRPLQTNSLQNHRVKIGKGLRGKYWQISFANVNGGDFSFDSITALVMPLSRRF